MWSWWCRWNCRGNVIYRGWLWFTDLVRKFCSFAWMIGFCVTPVWASLSAWSLLGNPPAQAVPQAWPGSNFVLRGRKDPLCQSAQSWPCRTGSWSLPKGRPRKRISQRIERISNFFETCHPAWSLTFLGRCFFLCWCLRFAAKRINKP